MRKIFQDSELQSRFLRDGYLLIPNFLSGEEVTKLKQLAIEAETGFNKGFHVTNWSANADYRENSHKEICRLLEPRAAEYLDNYKPILGCYAMKYTGEESEMGIHQDWSLVDESRYASLSFWCPLVDANANSGVLKIMPGSHRYFRNIRGRNIRFPFLDIQEHIKQEHLIDVPVKAGDALLLHHRLVHMSGPNNSGSLRPVAMLAMAPREADIMHYSRRDAEGTAASAFSCKDDFYLHFNIESIPDEFNTEQTFEYPDEQIEVDTLHERMRREDEHFSEAEVQSVSIL